MLDRSRFGLARAGVAALAVSFAATSAAALQLTQLTFGVPPPASQSEFEPAWSPDGSQLAFSGDYSTPGAFEPWWYIGLVAATGGATSEFQPGDIYYNAHPVWSPDGTHIAFANRWFNVGLWIAPLAGGTPTQLFAEDWVRSLAWSPDGTRIAFEAPYGVIRSVPPTGGAPLPLVPQADAHNPSWSADGSKLAFDSAGHIWVLDVAAGTTAQITTGAGNHEHPTWSPDGHWIAFSSAQSGSADLWVVASNGGDPVRLTTDPGAEREPAWSPDGERIAFSVWNPDQGAHVWIASDLPDFTVPVRPASWTAVKRQYR